MGLDILSQVQQANAQAAQANYQAAVVNNSQQMQQRNAAIQEQNARYDEQQGAIAEGQQRQKTAQLIGSQRASLASQSGDIDSGSDVDLVGDTARAGEFDALTTRSNAQRQAYNARLQAMNAQNQVGLAGADSANYGRQANYAMDRLPYSIGSSLLSDASRAASLLRT
jgi:hypothetical protein